MGLTRAAAHLAAHLSRAAMGEDRHLRATTGHLLKVNRNVMALLQ
jgi:hypothetical protein